MFFKEGAEGMAEVYIIIYACACERGKLAETIGNSIKAGKTHTPLMPGGTTDS